MPDKDGLEVIPTLRRLDKGVPIVAISGGSTIYAADPLPVPKILGSSGAIRKPFIPGGPRLCLK